MKTIRMEMAFDKFSYQKKLSGDSEEYKDSVYGSTYFFRVRKKKTGLFPFPFLVWGNISDGLATLPLFTVFFLIKAS